MTEVESRIGRDAESLNGEIDQQKQLLARLREELSKAAHEAAQAASAELEAHAAERRRALHEVGDRLRAVKRAFPKVKLDKSTAQMFGIFVARVPKGGGGRMEFAIDEQSRRVTTIAIPGLAFCE